MRAYVLGALLGWLIGAVLIGGLLTLWFGSTEPGADSSTAMFNLGGLIGIVAGLFGGHLYLKRRIRLREGSADDSAPVATSEAEEDEPFPAWFGRAFLAFIAFMVVVAVLGLVLGRLEPDDLLIVMFRASAIAFWFFVGLSILVAASRTSGGKRMILGGIGWLLVALVAAASLANAGFIE